MPTLPTLADGSLPQLYDCALNGIGYRVGWQIVKNLAFRHDPYQELAKDIVVEKNDTSVEEMTENKVDALYWESQRSWHEGAGQMRFDDPKNSSPYAYSSSTFMNVTNKGLAYLIPAMTSMANSAANVNIVNPILIECGGFLFQSTSRANLPFQKILPSAFDGFAPTLSDYTFGLAGALAIGDACSDGQNIYIGFNNLNSVFQGANNINPAASGFAQIQKGRSQDAAAITYCSTAFGAGSIPPHTLSMGFVKGQLIAAGPFVNAGAQSQWRIFQVAQDPTPSTELLRLPPGYWVPRHGICEIAGFALILATSNHNAVVYAWDGFTTPYICCYLPEGDQALAITSYLGVEVNIGARRLKPAGSNSLGNGVLFVGQATAAGQLALEEVLQIGDNNSVIPLDPNNPTGNTDAADYAITCLVNRGRYTYFNWGSAAALGCYDHANRAFSRQTGISTGTSPSAMLEFCTVQGRLASPVQVTSVNTTWVENVKTLVNSGTIIGSMMDWNIDKLKSVAQAQFGTLPLPTGTSATMDYSLDNGVTWTNVLTSNVTNNTMVQTTNTLTNQFLQTAPVINYRITLNSDTATHTLTPILKKAGFGAWYGEKPKKTWTVAVDIGDGQRLKNNAPFVLLGSTAITQGDSPSLWQLILNNVRNLWANQSVVSWQPPGYGDTHNDIFVVQVRGYTAYRWYESAAGFGGIVFVELKEAP